MKEKLDKKGMDKILDNIKDNNEDETLQQNFAETIDAWLNDKNLHSKTCLLYTSPSPRD